MKTMKLKVVIGMSLITSWIVQTASAFYDPSTGRWLSRDPIGERGFQALQRAPAASYVQPQPVSAQAARWLNRAPIFQREELNLYRCVGNDPINLTDVLGLSQQDVNVILNGYYQATQEMNDAGHRYSIAPFASSANSDISGHWWNPFYWTPWYNGKGWECYSQSKYLAERLNGEQYEDQWRIQTMTRPDFTHTWVEATSSNPSDPNLRFDPWWGAVNTAPPRISTSLGDYPPVSNTIVNNIPTVNIPPFTWGRGRP
jgi:hypothetical protein